MRQSVYISRSFNFPFVGRDAAIDKALPFIELHAAAGATVASPASRGKNERLFAVGAPGIGKTRFGQEFPQLLKKKIAQ